jgi:hypothetical protein
VVVLGLAGGFFVLKGGKSAEPPKPAAVVTPAAPEVEKIEIKVTSTPPGAMILRADQAEGPRMTPAVFKLNKGDPSFDVSIKLDGYKPQNRTIQANASKVIEVVLAKDESAAPAVVAPPPVVKKKKKAVGTDNDMNTLAPVF